MIRRNFTNPGGLPFDQNILKSIDDGILNDGVFEILRSLQSSNIYEGIILTGIVVTTGAIPGGISGTRHTVSAGTFFYANNIYSFDGGYVDILTGSANVPALQIDRTSSNLTYNSGASQSFYTQCTSTLTSSPYLTPATDAIGTKIPIRMMPNLPTKLGAAYYRPWVTGVIDDGDPPNIYGAGTFKVRQNHFTKHLEFLFYDFVMTFNPSSWNPSMGSTIHEVIIGSFDAGLVGGSGSSNFFGVAHPSSNTPGGLPGYGITRFGTTDPVDKIWFRVGGNQVSMCFPKIAQSSIGFTAVVCSVFNG